MTKYLVLYRSPTSAQAQMANASPEQAQAGMDAWMNWAGAAGSAIVDLGSPVGHVDTLGGDSGPSDSALGGYSIMEADSIEVLRNLLDGHPHLMMDGASIEVHEFLSLPGM